MTQHVIVETISSSQIITSLSAALHGMQIGTDGVNDPTVTVYDGVDNTGNEIVPTTTYDASALGISGFVAAYAKRAYSGIFVEISGAGAVEVTIDFRNT